MLDPTTEPARRAVSPCSAAGRHRFAFLLLAISVLIIYANSFQGVWVLDDFPNIVDNANVHPESLRWPELKKSVYGIDRDHNRIRRPLSYLTLALNDYVKGDDRFGFHAVNFTIHLLSACFLFCLIHRTLNLPVLKNEYASHADAIALLSTFLWATHPIQVTAVTYIVQRMTSMAGLFHILAMLMWVRLRTRPAGENRSVLFGLCMVFAILALASKENAALLPVSLVAYDLVLIQGISRKTLKSAVIPLGLAALLLLSAALYHTDPLKLPAAYGDRPFSMVQRLMTEPRVIIHYLGQLLYPVSENFTLLHDIPISTGLFEPWTTLPAAAFIALLACVTLGCTARYPLACFCLLFFLINHLIEGTIIPLEIAFEHRNYLPSIFIFIPAAILFLRSVQFFSYHPPIRWLLIAAVTVILAAQGHTTHIRNALFKSEIVFWYDNVKKSPRLHRPRHDLGRALVSAGYTDEGFQELVMALGGRAAARKNQKYITHYNLGLVHLDADRFRAAMDAFRKTQDLLPGFPQASDKIATIYLIQGHLGPALSYVMHALKNEPQAADFLYTFCRILLKKGAVDQAIARASFAFSKNRDDPRFPFLMGEAFRIQCQMEKALAQYKEAGRLDPKNPFIRLALVETYHDMGKTDALKREVRFLCSGYPEPALDEVLKRYRQRHNYAGEKRMESLGKALKAAR